MNRLLEPKSHALAILRNAAARTEDERAIATLNEAAHYLLHGHFSIVRVLTYQATELQEATR